MFEEPEGHLSSPGYPNPPAHAVFCQYVISVESGFTVTLNFSDNFHVESVPTERGPGCLHHWLEVTGRVFVEVAWGTVASTVTCPPAGGRPRPPARETVRRNESGCDVHRLQHRETELPHR